MEYKIECNHCKSPNLNRIKYFPGIGTTFGCLNCGNNISLTDIEFVEINNNEDVIPTLNIDDLGICFLKAQKNKSKYLGVSIQIPGFEKPEIVINPIWNFENKLYHYKASYNHDLTFKLFDEIKIIGFSYGDTYEEIEDELIF